MTHVRTENLPLNAGCGRRVALVRRKNTEILRDVQIIQASRNSWNDAAGSVRGRGWRSRVSATSRIGARNSSSNKPETYEMMLDPMKMVEFSIAVHISANIDAPAAFSGVLRAKGNHRDVTP